MDEQSVFIAHCSQGEHTPHGTRGIPVVRCWEDPVIGFGLWWGNLGEGLMKQGPVLDWMLSESRRCPMIGHLSKSEHQGG